MKQKSISNNYIAIQGWMVEQLNLKGNELLAYALIHGFSQDQTSQFTDSIAYIQNGSTAPDKQYLQPYKPSKKKGYSKNTKSTTTTKNTVPTKPSSPPPSPSPKIRPPSPKTRHPPSKN